MTAIFDRNEARFRFMEGISRSRRSRMTLTIRFILISIITLANYSSAAEIMLRNGETASGQIQDFKIRITTQGAIRHIDSNEVVLLIGSNFQLKKEDPINAEIVAKDLSIQVLGENLKVSISDISGIRIGATTSLSEGKLSDFKKEAIKSIRDLTLQLILISVGVFAITAGFLAKDFQIIPRVGGQVLLFAFPRNKSGIKGSGLNI